MHKLTYVINDQPYEVSIENSPPFSFGKPELLSSAESDIVHGQDFFPAGFKSIKFLDDAEFLHLKKGLTGCIAAIIATDLGIATKDFELERYHEVVRSSDDHLKVVSRTRDLFPEDFNFPIAEMLPKFERILGFGLSDINPRDGARLHIIIRINRPFSTDQNPPHKDIYELWDGAGYIPRFVNLWIPICGVTANSSLSIVPGSHLIPEDRIRRTFEGGMMDGNRYRVRMISEWDGSNRMERAAVACGEVLMFSSHLIHGMGFNCEKASTRVALEFRLFKRE